ncbi:MAG: acylphosphatase [Deltaproteobacteria bacterium]|nr:acylphosphatase [Deltaproteobacteria bacterium]
MTKIKAYSFRIYGLVQGVAFRYSARREANSLNLSGWIRNQSDGSVEGFVEGDEDKVKVFIEWCHKGPVTAKVEKVILKESTPQNLRGFEIKY